QYGAVSSRIAPVLGEEQALAQLRLARRLWNLLVAIERVRLARYRRIMRDEVQEQIDQLKQNLDALREQVRARRKRARQRVPAPELGAEIGRVKAARNMLLDHQKSTKDERHQAHREQLTALSARTSHRIKRARQAAASLGLFWGTY